MSHVILCDGCGEQMREIQAQYTLMNRAPTVDEPEEQHFHKSDCIKLWLEKKRSF